MKKQQYHTYWEDLVAYFKGKAKALFCMPTYFPPQTNPTRRVPPQLQTKEYLTTDELALKWNLSASTLSNWRWEGKGPTFVKVGKSVRYKKHTIEEYEKTYFFERNNTIKIGNDNELTDYFSGRKA